MKQSNYLRLLFILSCSLFCICRLGAELVIVNRGDAIKTVHSLVEFIVKTETKDKTVTAIVHESVETNHALFEKSVYDGLSRLNPEDSPSILTRSNGLAFLLTGERWRVVRESSDDCVHLLDERDYSITNIIDGKLRLNIPQMSTNFHERFVYDPQARNGYKTARLLPEISSLLTDESGRPRTPLDLRLVSVLEHEISFLVLLALRQTNSHPRTYCNSTLYDFTHIDANSNNIVSAFDQKNVSVSKPVDNSYSVISLIPQPGARVDIEYDANANLKVRRLAFIKDGITRMIITRRAVRGLPWQSEWFDDKYDTNSARLSFVHRYVISEVSESASSILEGLDEQFRKVKIASRKNQAGGYTLSSNGKIVSRYKDSSSSEGFIKNNIGVIVSVSITLLSVLAFTVLYVRNRT